MPEKKDNTALLKEIRDEYDYYVEAWRSIREEADTDMQYISGDPWEPKERKIREDNDRPCMTWDELSPYINKLVNDPKQNKRAIQVNPKGSGANDATAELRGNIIREIEYNSKAQSAFTTGFQGAAERSYGYWGVMKRYVSSVGKTASTDAFNQELYIRRIPNPDAVLFHPLFKEIDASDAMGCFVLDRMRQADFVRQYPNAEKQSFTTADRELAPNWIFGEKEIQVAEYWKVTLSKKSLYMFKGGDEGPTAYFEDELPKDMDIKQADDKREIEQRVVTQYITNGVEILDETEIEIPFIPVVPVFGKEIWVNKGSGSERMLISLTRMARDPFMAYCYYRSQEAEEAGMTPRSPFIAYKGQIDETDKDIWATVNKVPRAFLEINPVMDSTGQQLLPPPVRMPFSPNFEAYEVACEAARRAIMTAMSGSVLPTAAQRRNDKSGIALKEIDSQEDQGTFHFIDNYNHALEQTGRILDAWIPFVYDTKREIGIRKPDETHATVTINDPNNTNDQGKPEPNDTKTGEHGVTITVGPSDNSQRDAADAFLDTIVANIEAIAQLIPPGAAAKLLALGITMKNMGPLGKEIADTISPPQDAQAAQQQLQQAQASAAAQQEVIQKMQAELQKLQLEKAGKVIQGETQKQLQQMENDIKVLIALIQAKTQNATQEQEMYQQFWVENHGAAHELAMQKDQQGHEKTLATQAAQQQQAGQVSDQAHEATMAAGQQQADQQAQEQPAGGNQ